MSCEAQRGIYLHPTYAVRPVRELHVILDACMWTRAPGDDSGVRPGSKESEHSIEGFARVAALAERLPETRLVCVADRESDMVALMVPARELDKAAD